MLISDGHFKTGCICRSFSKDMESWKQLLSKNTWKFNANNRCIQHRNWHCTVRQKRGREDDEHNSGEQRPRMVSASADASVSSKSKKLHPKVAKSTSVSPAVPLRFMMFSACQCFYHQCLLLCFSLHLGNCMMEIKKPTNCSPCFLKIEDGRLLAWGTHKSGSQCLRQPNCCVLDGNDQTVASKIQALCLFGFNLDLRSTDVTDLTF